jgi:maltose O-acetyltransferase
MTEKEKMLQGKLYIAGDKELKKDYFKAMHLTRLFNLTEQTEKDERQALLKQLLGSMGENVTIMPPFRCDYGKNISIGNDFFANYDCIMLDVCKISIGHRVMFGPRVSLYTASHPIDAKIRASGLEYGKEIHIEDDVWIGGSTVITGGVTIGKRSIIGSGSVVVKDIPSDVIAAGNPCRVIRKITENDKQEWVKKAQEH